ncbi:MAG: hypothetical protein RBU21_07610 [FCB group bacterium]|nr:hypothetical protein [FCB group bacterium]
MGEDGDGYIRDEGASWTLGTASMEKTIVLQDGQLVLKSFKDKASGAELVGGASAELSFGLDAAENRVTGTSGGWTLVDAKQSKGSQGELQLDLQLRREGLEVTKTYVVYPESSIVREWVTFRNAGDKSVTVIDPSFLNVGVSTGKAEATDFMWMTGGENNPGSWDLKTETLAADTPRTFDSYEPFPVDLSKMTTPGDGVNVKILHNDKQVWPEEGWKYLPNATVTEPFDLSLDTAAGDTLVFLVNMNKEIGFDTTAFPSVIAYEDGETHSSEKEFSGEQGKNGWNYRYIENGKYVDLVYYALPNQWRKETDNATGTPFVGYRSEHPDVGQDAARVWTAPKAGKIRLTGSACNTANGPYTGGHGFRPGTSTYAPWYALYNKESRQGVFIGWDYFGHWSSSFVQYPSGAVAAQLNVAGFKKTLAPGESFSTPKAFVGLFRDDLDNAGNECLDWQYRYLWDYTREGWFPAIRMLGYWMNGTGWGQPGVAWTGGGPDWDSTFRKVFRVSDLMRSVGADVYHRDWGWWDKAGDWNGPDFRTTINYLAKSDMRQLIYAFLYTVDPTSKVAQEHPDWVVNGTLDMEKPEVVAFMKGQLDTFVERWGHFEWRNDSFFTISRDGDDTGMIGQDEGLRQVIRDFLDKYPECAFQAVNGGGNYGGYDYVRYASTFSFSDGAVGILRNYYASLLFPPDKTSDIPDVWNPDKYEQATWRGLLCINFDMTGDTWDPAKVEGIRELIDIYHYLHAQGVVGRWVHVYRPIIEGDDPTMYLQRLSGDGMRGIIIPKRPAEGAVTVKPKGLKPDANYVVSFHESDASETRTGADLMEKGIAIEKMPAGELIYLNLPLHPGSTLDTEAPAAPASVAKRVGENMGYPGVEVTWEAATDNNWLSYYRVFRDGVALDNVAKGTFYFDHSVGADPAAVYEILSVDGAGNVSPKTAAEGAAGAKRVVIDDAAGSGIAYTGAWTAKPGLLPAHAATLTSSNEKGAAAEVSVEGKRALVFVKMGPECGKAAVSFDGGAPAIVDTYSADEIWGVCVYRKELAAGKHTLRVEVTGERGERAKDAVVHLDGVRVEVE